MLDTKKIFTLRKALGLNQEQAATAAGMGARTRWNDIESGRRANVTLSTLQSIADALGCAPCELLINGGKKPRAAKRA